MEDEAKSQFKFSRLIRTATSEAYIVWQEDTRVGHFHLHYAHDTIHAALLLEVDLSVEEEGDLLDAIDDDIVSSYLPSFDREDFLVTMFSAQEMSSFSYTPNDIELGPEDEE